MDGNILVSPQGRFFQKWARNLFFAAVGLAPFVFIPVPWVPLQLGKLLVCVTLLAASALFYLAGAIRDRKLELPRARFLLVAALVPVAYLLASFLATNTGLSLTGQAIETDTFFFAALLFVTLSLGVTVMRSRGDLRRFALFVMGGSAIAVLFQYLQLTLGPGLFGLSFLGTPSSNIVGKWNDLGIIAGLLALMSIVLMEFGALTRRLSIGSIVALALSLFLLAVINFNVAWAALFVIALSVAGVAFLSQRRAEAAVMGAPTARRRIPYAAGATALISLAFVLLGTSLNGFIAPLFSVSELEARPSVGSTLEVMSASYADLKVALVGYGPNHFPEAWRMHKPAEINTSAFWDSDFIGGFGAVPTAFVTTGLLGGIAWLMLLAYFIAIAVRQVRRGAAIDAWSMAAAAGSLFLLAMMVTYLPSPAIGVIAFAFIGAVVASRRLDGAPVITLSLMGGARKAVVASLALLAIVLVVALGEWKLIQKFASSTYFGKALYTASVSGDIFAGAQLAERAVGVEGSDRNLRLAAQLGLELMRAAAADSTGTDDERRTRFEAVVRPTISYAIGATQAAPKSPENWVMLARVYDFLAELGVQGAYDNAKQSYAQAIELNPRNPGLPLLLARLEAVKGEYAATEAGIVKALELKSNFTDAILLGVQLEVVRGNLGSASQAAQAAVLTAPQNAGLWFQLGLIEYTRGIFANATQAFGQALQIAPDYANAKYFLGLTYAQMGKRSDAVALFQDLESTNPDNQEVKLILANLRAGKEPFAGAKPPVSTAPEKRETAPIRE